ncbi:MAG: hypothetical protein JSW27_13215 [Phycisphaerales bacterium]|nr:MAG: hypothetical protein JSW27_13215 [Phycisphaerales bacterium]
MWKQIIILTAATWAVAGCTPSYRVHVNGYTELSESIARSAALYVAIDPNSPNPIFQKQIKDSAAALLRDYGYTIAETPEAADYRATFQAGMESETVMGYTPSYHAYYGPRGGYPGRFRFGYSVQTPYFDTVYDQWLVLKLFKAGSPPAATPNPVWIGEAMLSTDRAELRETVDYLLIGCIEYLGVDTGRKVTVKIREDDPRLMSLRSR